MPRLKPEAFGTCPANLGKFVGRKARQRPFDAVVSTASNYAARAAHLRAAQQLAPGATGSPVRASLTAENTQHPPRLPMADQWTDFGSGFEDTGDGQQLETDLFATGGVFDEVKADAFEAVAAAQPSNPPPPPLEQTASEQAAEADAVRRLQAGEVATLEGVYAVLRRLSRSDQEPFPPSVSVRPRASPFAAFASDHDAFFVSRERAPPVTGPPQTNTVSVAFQSPLNGECWWDPQNPANGVCARPMARRYRSGESAGQVHGYRGRQYTLVQRRLPDGPAAADRNAQCSLVQIWKEAHAPQQAVATRKSRKRHKAKGSDEDDAGSDAGSSATGVTGSDVEESPRWLQAGMASGSSSGGWASSAGSVGGPSPPLQQRPLSPSNQGHVVADDVRFLGSIYVSGRIHGTLVTPPGAADYGEWFPWSDSVQSEKGQVAPPGTVVRLVARKLSLDTTHGSGPCLVTSTSPSLAAGVPCADDGGATCAFLGQVPVRCRGPVRCGDLLVPSGLSDGVAIGRRCSDREDALGVALESGDSPHDMEHTVLCLVRWREKPPPVNHVPRILWCLAVLMLCLEQSKLAVLLLCLATWPF